MKIARMFSTAEDGDLYAAVTDSGEHKAYRLTVISELQTEPDAPGIATRIRLARPILALEELPRSRYPESKVPE